MFTQRESRMEAAGVEERGVFNRDRDSVLQNKTVLEMESDGTM